MEKRQDKRYELCSIGDVPTNIVPAGEMRSSKRFVFNRDSRYGFLESSSVRNGEKKSCRKNVKENFCCDSLPCSRMSSIINVEIFREELFRKFGDLFNVTLEYNRWYNFRMAPF